MQLKSTTLHNAVPGNNPEKLKQFAPEPQPLHCVQKTEAVPKKALFKDEKYISDTIDILSKIVASEELVR